jgi:hypothetical protein
MTISFANKEGFRYEANEKGLPGGEALRWRIGPSCYWVTVWAVLVSVSTGILAAK